MRRILSKEEEQKKGRKNQFLIGGVMILVMIASTVGYAFSRENTGTVSNSDKLIYNGFEFSRQTSGFWELTKGDYQFLFKYNPNETVKATSSLNLLASYSGKPLYVDSDNAEAVAEIYRNLFYQNRIVERFQEACLKGENCSNQDNPVKTCEDNLIVIKTGNQTGTIKQQQNCVFITGNSENLTSLSDSFLYKIIGVQ
jgi:hypothetical protein